MTDSVDVLITADRLPAYAHPGDAGADLHAAESVVLQPGERATVGTGVAIALPDVDGVLVNRMNTTPDGQFQTYSTEDGSYIREHFFGVDPRLRKMVEHMSDTQIEKLPRGGHDYRKVYAAFDAATKHSGQPTVILAHTIKGWTIDAL